MAVVYSFPTPFLAGFRTIEGSDLNTALAAGPILSAYSGVTALSGGGTTGPVLIGSINQISTTAATNDSVSLPAAKVGARVIVTNGGTSTAAIYANALDHIGSGSAGGSTTQATGITAMYVCPVSNTWYRMLSA